MIYLIGEFSVRNKPVITQDIGVFDDGYQDYHNRILKDKGFYYRNKEGVIAIIDKFITNGIPKDVNYNAYNDFEPSVVMKSFEKIFLNVNS